jgi:hypothetical protein
VVYATTIVEGSNRRSKDVNGRGPRLRHDPPAQFTCLDDRGQLVGVLIALIR